MIEKRFENILSQIDLANQQDPNKVMFDGAEMPVELLYGQRMSAELASYHPNASEELAIAARAQHIERWTSQRSDYPEGRAGYLRWRKDLQAHHANRTGELMANAGYDADAIARAQSLLRKEGIKRSEDAQILEDVICLVFLKFYAAEFIAKHEDDKVVDILQKTAKKMSSQGLEAAAKLPVSGRLAELLTKALA